MGSSSVARGAMSWLSRAAGRLVPAGRRDWPEALWAEAGQVRPGLARLAWRAGGLRLIVREARLLRRAARALVFAAAAAWVVRSAWPGPASNPATAVNRLNVVTVLPALAVLPLVTRWLLGPAVPGRTARALRYGAYAAVLVLMVAKAGIEQVRDNLAVVPQLNSDASVPGKDGMIATWLAESVFVFLVAGYVAAILALTSRRSRVAPATLAAGTGAGIVLGAVMYLVAPLGLTSTATDPWLPALGVNLLVLLAWLLLLGGPVAAAGLAVRCCRAPGGPEQLAGAKLRQGLAAGSLTTVVGALMVAVLGTGTVALMPRAGWVLRWLYPGQHLLAAVASSRELTASVRSDFYGLIMLAFPAIGLVMGFIPYAYSVDRQRPQDPPSGGGPPGPPGPEPAPEPSGGGLLAGAGAGRLPAAGAVRLPGGRGTTQGMSVQLNHTIVACRDQQRSAAFLTGILGLPPAKPFGHFLVVEADNGVSLDFATAGGQVTPQHYAFLVGEEDFDAAFGRIRDQDLPYWADPARTRPGTINHRDGGRGLYFQDPDGHLLEILTRPYGSGG